MANELIEDYAFINKQIKEAESEIKVLKKRKAEMEEPLLELFMQLGVKSVKTIAGSVVYLHRQVWANARPSEDGGRDFRSACAALEATGHGEMVETKFNVMKVSSLVRELENSEDGIPIELHDNLVIKEKVMVKVRG